MYQIAMDQNRQDNIPTQHTLQVHMHHLCCPCSNVIYPYYPPGYRPPILAQPPPIPRPSYLHHYQYTQLHVNPTYSVPLPPTMAQPLTQTMSHSPPSTVDLAFGPPPRDRRNLDGQEFDDQRTLTDKNKSDNRDSLLQYTPLSTDNTYSGIASPSNENFMDLTAAQVAALSTENYITYLVNGCVTGERIAKRNEHRPCFKNIQNLCNRTRSEVVKPNITVSNIHSQGMPWATKDFIFAFVRAINCWCILRGYLGCKDGNLGKIEKEISPEFRACYTKWEKCTKQLTHYLIETFCKLDEANSPSSIVTNSTPVQANPGPSTAGPSSVNLLTSDRNTSPAQETKKPAQSLPETATQNVERNLPNKEMSNMKGIPGILHIPPATSTELGEARNPTSESTEISPRDDDSDTESRVYMKPGSYNVPTKQLSSQSNTNSPRSVEFFDTAQNVSAYQKKIAAEKSDTLTTELLREKVWKTAQNITPDFIKQNEETGPNVSSNNVEKLFEVISSPQQNKKIESWLNNEKNRFDCRVLDIEEDSIQPGDESLQCSSSGKFIYDVHGKEKPRFDILDWIIGKTRLNDSNNSRCNSSINNDMERPYRSFKKRVEIGDLRPLQKSYNSQRRSLSTWENKSGGLTDSAITLMDRIIKELEREDFAAHIRLKPTYTRSNEYELKNPTDLNTIYKKFKTNKYVCINEIVHDIRHICYSASEFYTDGQTLKQLAQFRERFEDMMSQAFPHMDFQHVKGEPNEMIGPVVIKTGRNRKAAEGDGDH